MLNNQTINLEGNPNTLDIFRFANAQAAKGFTTKLPKLETPCEFYRKNKFRRFNYNNFCKLKNYFVHLRCKTIVSQPYIIFSNRCFSKYSTLDLERPKGLYRFYDSFATPFREFLFLNIFLTFK